MHSCTHTQVREDLRQDTCWVHLNRVGLAQRLNLNAVLTQGLGNVSILCQNNHCTHTNTHTHTHTHTHKRLNSLALFNFKNFQGKHLTVDFISFLFFTMQKHLTSPPSPHLIFWHLPKCFKSCQYSTLALNVNGQFY